MAEADDGASTPWEPLSGVDYMVLGFVGTFQTLALGICGHLLWYRKWPPYVTKNVNLVVIATISGVLWTVTMAISSGYVPRHSGDVLAACDLERFLSWSTLCVHTVSFFIRVYRMWRVLIKHDDNMWHTEHQILFMSSLSLIPVASTWAIPETGVFDEVANTCSTTSISSYITIFMDFLAFMAIVYLWFVCARQLKWVRKQFNEYQTMRRTLLYMTLSLLSYVAVVIYWLGDDLVTQRRVSIFYPLSTTYILLWGSIREPFTMKMMGDESYLLSYTKGFSNLPSPAQLRASLAEQLSVDQLRIEFRRYIKTRVAQELVDFYLDSLDREEVAGFFERQAVTMRIVEQYIREGSPDQVNISEECREKVLATDVTAYDIFDDARAEVLAVMETNFRREFVTTEGYRRLVDASEEEQREIRLLRAGGMLPDSPPSPISPRGDSRSSPLLSPLIPRLVRNFKKLPFVRDFAAASDARSASATRRAVRAGRGARVGGSARVSADAIGASGRDGGGNAVEAAMSAAAKQAAAVPRGGAAGAEKEVWYSSTVARATARAVGEGFYSGPVEAGPGGGKGSRSPGGARSPGIQRGAAVGVASALPAQGGVPSAALAAKATVLSSSARIFGGGGREGSYLGVAEGGWTLSSASGSNIESSDSLSADSLRGLKLAGRGNRRGRFSGSGGGSGGGRSFAFGPEFKREPEARDGTRATSAADRPVPSGAGGSSLGGRQEAGGPAAAPRGEQDRGDAGPIQEARSAGSTAASQQFVDGFGTSFEGGNSPPGLARLESGCGGSNFDRRRNEPAAEAFRLGSGVEVGEESTTPATSTDPGAGAEPGLETLAAGVDRIEDGVEGFEDITPISEAESPAWVRFSDWIAGTETRREAGARQSHALGRVGAKPGDGRARSYSSCSPRSSSYYDIDCSSHSLGSAGRGSSEPRGSGYGSRTASLYSWPALTPTSPRLPGAGYSQPSVLGNEKEELGSPV